MATRVPKLRIRSFCGNVPEDTCTLEDAKSRFNWGVDPFLIVVEDRAVHSYEELVDLAGEDRFKDREFLEVALHPILIGG